jgi:type VI secretion system protein ImpA
MPLPLEDEIESLTAPLSGDNPAGDAVPYGVREALDEARKEVNPNDFPPDYPGRPELKRADWAGIERRCVELLKSSSKDLMVAARLTEALVQRYGFAGAWSGFRVLRGLVEDAWDRVHPVIEDGDLEVRATPFVWLDDPARGARFPSTLRAVPLVQGPTDQQRFCYLDWEKAKAGRGVSMDQFDQSVLRTPRAECQTACDALEGALGELGRLSAALDARMSAYAPGLLEVRKALEQCRLLERQILDRKGPAPAAEAPAPPAAQSNGAAAPLAPAVPPPAPGRGETREELYASLAATASRLQRMEPHSPIPILIQLAVELGALPFPQLMGALAKDQLMNALIRDPGVLQEIARAASVTPGPH